MKRKIALTILMLLTFALALTACNQAATTTAKIRWDSQETHVFNIKLADIKGQSLLDEMQPVAAGGTYTIVITPDGTKYCDVETNQVMYVKYKVKADKTNGVDFEKYPDLLEVVADESEYQAAGLTKDEGTTILKSTTVTTVRFENTSSQKPVESSTSVDGFYVGSRSQERSHYDISTTYSYSSKRPVATTTTTVYGDGEPTKSTDKYKFDKNSAGKFIDKNQILLYLRSLDKSSTSFQDSPSKSVFNPLAQKLQTANFSLSYKYKTTLNDYTEEDKTLAITLNAVSVSVDGFAFMMQENLPDTLASKGYDRFYLVDDPEPKFTTVRFRVGYFVYEIDYNNESNTTEWADIWTFLTPAPEPEDQED